MLSPFLCEYVRNERPSLLPGSCQGISLGWAFDTFHKCCGSVHVAVVRELFAFDVAATSMPAAEPGHTALGNRLARRFINTFPLEIDHFSVKHHNRPGHGDAWLRENSPPVGFSGCASASSIERPISAEIDKVSGILFGEQVAPALPQGFTMGRPPHLVLFLDLRQVVRRANFRQLVFAQRNVLLCIADHLLPKLGRNKSWL